MQQLENDLDQTQEKLMNANQRLEEKEKALQNVSLPILAKLTRVLFLFPGASSWPPPWPRDVTW